MPGNRKRDIEIFTKAIELSDEERNSFLDRVCADDAELHQRVEDLLKSNERVGSFLETHPVGPIGEWRANAVAGEKPGDRVDRYRLLQQIGEGGCGIVFMAEQEEPVRRRVALKVIKPGMDTKSVIARFEAERQALALMDHPNIAHVLDAGTTESGRPYFVMELVRGTKITNYCEQKCLTTPERLQLFVKVCEGVQHAHQKGIIHRDIKPSNILVMTESDGTALPKIIDFGIAKATTNQRLTDKTLFTAFEMLMGTPAYMSPEQALLTSVDVDTRTDIYSLGVLLYELLTGTTPFDSHELLKSGLDEIRRVITSQEPVRPSTRLKTLLTGDSTALSQHQLMELPRLIKDIRGDLDWVVMKALEKDRARRYATAHGLALDVQRFLAAEPVSARSPSRIYRFQKLVLRNKLVFTGASVIALVLVVGLVVVSMAFRKERQARQVASAASAKSQQVTKFLEDMLNAAGPAAARGRDTTILREILDQTVTRIGKELSNQPEVEAELRDLIGKLYEQMGLGGKAEEMERKALAIRQQQFGPESLEAAASLNDLGLELMAQHKLPEAEKVHREALIIRRRLLGENNADTATSINDLGAVYRDQGKLPEAEALAQEGLRIRRKLSGTNNLDVADSLRNLAIIRGSQSRWDEAERMARDVLGMRRELLGPEHVWIASALEDVAWAASGLGKYEEAMKLDGEALVMRHNLLGESHPDMARNLNALGQLLKNRGELPAADAVLKAALSIQRKLVGDDQQATLETFYALAQVLDAEAKTAEAESMWRQALAIWARRGEDANPDRLYNLRGLGDTLEHEGRWPEAEAVWRESLVLWRKRGGIEEQQSMYTLRKLALALEAERKWPEAESMQREALAISRKKGNEDPEALADLERLVRVLAKERKFNEAEQLLNNVLTPAFLTQTSSANLLVQRVNVMGRQGRWREAASDAALALEDQPTDHYRYHTLVGLLAITHDRPAYEQLCKKLLAKFANPANPFVAERMVQDCLLLADSGVDLDSVDKLADIAVTAGRADPSMPYFQACKAMSNYRLGNFRLASEWAEKALNNPTVEALAKAKAFAVLAMASWQLGQESAARSALANGNALAPSLSSDAGLDLGESWVAWIMARVSLDEARTLIDPTMPTGNNSAAEGK